MKLFDPLDFLPVASLVMLASLCACSSTEEYPTTQIHSACGIECTLYDEDCIDKAMHECLL